MTIAPRFIGTSLEADSKARRWSGKALRGFSAAFLLLDGAMKVAHPLPVTRAMAQLGYRPEAAVGIGALLIALTLLYLTRRTSAIGAVLLTGYLGGAIASHVRVGGPLFPILFAGAFGAMLWIGLLLRDERLRELLLSRRERS